MKIINKGLAIILCVLSFPVAGNQDSCFEWNYLKGGEDWPGVCKTGSRQSPIDIKRPYYPSPNKITFHYLDKVENIEISNNEDVLETPFKTGNTIQASGSFGYMLYEQNRFDVIQIHFHVPSVHTIRGHRFSAEMHIVHRNQWGALVTVAVLFEDHFKDNDFLAGLEWGNFPNPNQSKKIKEAKGISFLNEMEKPIYVYKGSQESPPCREEILWFVTDITQVYISTKQLQQWPRYLLNNVRKIQPIKNRTIEVI